MGGVHEGLLDWLIENEDANVLFRYRGKVFNNIMVFKGESFKGEKIEIYLDSSSKYVDSEKYKYNKLYSLEDLGFDKWLFRDVPAYMELMINGDDARELFWDE